jgi:hypothetical protein
MAQTYLNGCSVGDRTAIITITSGGNPDPASSADGFSPYYAGSGSIQQQNQIDGSLNGGNYNGGSPWFGSTQSTNAGMWIQYDFGVSRIIDEARWWQDTLSTHGVWKWQGSNNASTWTDIGSSFTLGTTGSGLTNQVQTTLNGNTTPYRYYRLFGVSGVTSRSPYLVEVEFRIDDSGPSYTNQGIGDRSGGTLLTATSSSGFMGGGGNEYNFIDGNYTSVAWISTQALSSSVWMSWDFLTAVVMVKAFWYQSTYASQGVWKWQGSNDNSTWIDVSSPAEIVGSNAANPSNVIYRDGVTPAAFTIIDMSTNTTAYRYYRMVGVSGSSTTNPFVHEIEFLFAGTGGGSVVTLHTRLLMAGSGSFTPVATGVNIANVTLNGAAMMFIVGNFVQTLFEISLSMSGVGNWIPLAQNVAQISMAPNGAGQFIVDTTQKAIMHTTGVGDMTIDATKKPGRLDVRLPHRYFVTAGQIDKKLQNRYAFVAGPFDVNLRIRYQVGVIDAKIRHRYTVNGYLEKTLPNRFMVLPAIGSNAGSRYYSVALTAGEDGSAISPFELARRFNLGDLSVNFRIHTDKPPSGSGSNSTGDWDLSCIPYQFSITLTESQPAQWSLSLIDALGNFNPQKPGYWFEAMDEQPFAGGGDYTGTNIITKNNIPSPPPFSLAKTLSVSVAYAGMSKSYHLIGTSWNSTRSKDTRYFNFTWKGTDHSLLLNHDAITMKTVRSNARLGIQKASAVLKEIFAFVGIKYDLQFFRSEDDYVIPLMHRQNGNPRDWVAQILSGMMYEWKMVDGLTFTPYLPSPLNLITPTNPNYFASTSYGNNTYVYNPATANPNYVHTFSDMSIQEESAEGSMGKIYNRVVAIRAAEGGGTAKGGELEVFNFGDQYSIDFNPPISNVTYNVDYANNGFFSNFKYYSGSTLVATRGITIGSANEVITTGGAGLLNNISRVTFTWGVQPGGFIGLGAPGKISFSGTEEVEPSNWNGSSQFDTAGTIGTAGQWDYSYIYIDPTPDNPVPGFRAMSQNATLIQKYGLRAIEISASPLIPNKVFLQKFADRYLYRASRQARSATYKIPLNPYIEPGTLIREVDESLGVLDTATNKIIPLTRDRVVTTATHAYSSDPAQRYTTYSGNEYVQVS